MSVERLHLVTLPDGMRVRVDDPVIVELEKLTPGAVFGLVVRGLDEHGTFVTVRGNHVSRAWVATQ